MGEKSVVGRIIHIFIVLLELKSQLQDHLIAALVIFAVNDQSILLALKSYLQGHLIVALVIFVLTMTKVFD